MTDDPQASRGRARGSLGASEISGVALAFIVAYLVVQVALPVAGLATRSQTRFSWKMFIPDDGPHPRFTMVFRDGRTADLERLSRERPVAVVLRAEVDQAGFVPPHLCQRVPGAEAVIIEMGGKSRRHQCR
jgi:hypothetical protein